MGLGMGLPGRLLMGLLGPGAAIDHDAAKLGRPSEASIGRDALRREFERSRRFGHPLAVITIRHRPPEPAGERPAQPSLQPEEVRRHVRQVDSIWMDRGRLFVLLPETDRAAAELALARLRERVPAMAAAAGVGLAAFPEDAMTTQALMEHATSS